MHGTDLWNSLGLLVWIKAKALHPISLRWERDGFSPNQSSYGVLPLMEEEAVKFVRYADVAENSSQRSVGALHVSRIARAFPRIVRCKCSARPFWAEV